jgi:HEPN domain
MRRPEDWFRQAELDVQAATDARDHAHYEWACFLAQRRARRPSSPPTTGRERRLGATRSRACSRSSTAFLPKSWRRASRSTATTSRHTTHLPPERGAGRPIHRARRTPRTRGCEAGARPCQRSRYTGLTTGGHAASGVWLRALRAAGGPGGGLDRIAGSERLVGPQRRRRRGDRRRGCGAVSGPLAGVRSLAHPGLPPDVFVYTHEERADWGDRFERVEWDNVLY